MGQPQFSERHREVLAAVVVNYALTGVPVGSRTISKTFAEGLSPATIRNTMADLEDLGYLQHPHTSAGRVPTDRGYRLYVDTMLGQRLPSARERRLIEEARPGASDPADVHDLLTRTAKLLASLSAQVGLVLAPSFRHAILRRLEFLNLGSGRILGIFVSRSGIVDHRVIQVKDAVADADLEKITNLVNDNFQGLTLPEIRARVLQMMSEEKALYDRLLAQALELSRSYLERREGSDKEVLVEGACNVVGEPEFTDVERMKGLFRTFEDKGRLVEVLNACLEQDRTHVLIGSECPDPGLSELALITAPYRYRQRTVGAVGIIGPRRMQYDRQIMLVGALSEFLTECLARRAEGESADTGENPW